MKKININFLAYIFILHVFLFSCTDNKVIEPVSLTINYINPVEITINGYIDHAMEPFISPDGNTLFFNSLNNAIDTKLYYATKVNATTFTFIGDWVEQIWPTTLSLMLLQV